MKKLISFFEIPATDFSRAVTFYETVLEISLSVMECEEEKWPFSLPEKEKQREPFLRLQNSDLPRMESCCT